MPLPMVHISISKKILDAGLEITDIPQFYLGAISPDAIHMRKDSNRDKKNRTHLIPLGKLWRDVNQHEYYDFLLDFINTNEAKANIDFLWGYAIHILTDMHWTTSLYEDFCKKYNTDPSPIHERAEAYYNDCDVLDYTLFNDCEWRNNVWQSLERVKSVNSLDLLSAEEIDSWNTRTRQWYNTDNIKHRTPIKYITKVAIIDFISVCSKTIFQNIYSPKKRAFP